ncbi:MAG: FtsW/RodA/SpoVE family cell cycle protein [Candidatus Paceibacteria bacterium]
MGTKRSFDPFIFISVSVLVIGGFLIFMSASLGLLIRGGAEFSSIATTQFLLGIVGGFAGLYVASHIPYRFWRHYALWVFLVAVVLMLLVFVPGIGGEFNGARRWLDLRITTFQPAEFLKIAYVLFLGTWLSQRRSKKTSFLVRIAPFSIITAAASILLLAQPDTGTFLVLAATGGVMYFVSGARWTDLLVLALVGVIASGGLVLSRDYALERVQTYLNPAADPLGGGYQIQQSLIAVGSGQFVGRGFGQSVQKFNYLPEPTSDSIFAVFAEEFGFLGSIILILGFLSFGIRSLWIAARAPDLYGGLVTVGIAILIVFQSFLNIASMLGIFPLTGLPLIFVSHGGSALFMALVSVGILLNISRFRHT